jgi:hypothetical protein
MSTSSFPSSRGKSEVLPGYFDADNGRRSLEELDYMFEARIPTRQFGKFDSTAMMEEKRRQHHTNVEDVREEPEKMAVEGEHPYSV